MRAAWSALALCAFGAAWATEPEAEGAAPADAAPAQAAATAEAGDAPVAGDAGAEPEGDEVAGADVAEEQDASPPTESGLEAEVAALRAALAETTARLDALEQRTVRKGPGSDLRAEITGYYRVRGHLFGTKFGERVTGGLFDEQPTAGAYIQQRLRVGTAFRYKDIASLHVHVQALDDTLWGDNADIGSLPLFAEQPSQTRLDGLEAPPIQIFRAWTEFKVPIGVVRVGRQASHWGMGLLANHGDGFDDDFGENHFGNEFDRILFGTNPVKLVQAFTKKEEAQTPDVTLAIAVDRLVEGPLTEYFGYTCSSGVAEATSPSRYDPRCDADSDGVTDLDHGFTEDRTAVERTKSWWADSRDDVWEMVYALLYRGTDLPWLGGGRFTAGAYVIHRIQRETESNVVVGDLYLDLAAKGAFFQFEGVGILGRTRALNLPDASLPDPWQKKARIASYVLRAGYENHAVKATFEAGAASGDPSVADATFSGRAIHPDYNAGLLLYEEVIARVTQQLWGTTARGLRSKGGIYNSHYLFPRVAGRPLPWLQVIGGFLIALPDQPDGSVIRCTQADVERLGCPQATATAFPIGWEADLAVKIDWKDHVLFSLETGFARATDRLPLSTVGLNPTGNFWTLQSRVAWQF